MKDVKAVVLRVDSPGGEVFASEQIRREVVALKAGRQAGGGVDGGSWQRPVVTGSAMNADRIYADPSTITGSIGIFGMIPNVAAFAGQDRRAHRWRGHHPLRRCVRHDPSDLDPAVGQDDPVGRSTRATPISPARSPTARNKTGRGRSMRVAPRSRVERCAGQGTWPGRRIRRAASAAVADAAKRAKLGAADGQGPRALHREECATPFAQVHERLRPARPWAGAWMLGESGMART